MWEHLKGSASDTNPVFMSTDLETPFGLATFLACSSNFKKVYISGTYNLSQMLKQLPSQNSSWLVCDEEIFGIKAPEGYSEHTSGIKNVLVGGHVNSKSELFPHAKVKSMDPVTLH